MDPKPSIWKVIWEKWKRIAAKIAHVQGHIILSLIYGVVVTPVALLFKLSGKDPFQMKPGSGPGPSSWTPREPMPPASEFLKKEY